MFSARLERACPGRYTAADLQGRLLRRFACMQRVIDAGMQAIDHSRAADPTATRMRSSHPIAHAAR
ncbi:MAG: hypothetical protein AVDCRST_MAG71-179 [uncultured Lysobacter sp.]|uniref:Uncharacterized protein n=1 Tax=uncultured Lysobacter sp. TaxID=271060 RepID=A0A6J4KDD8_9GAMM|nr:MAG: hypothetical protein AVDCRST_MAG71-179 [uncultured Lysobacter sp.]